MATYGLHKVELDAPTDYEWFDDAKSFFEAWEGKSYRFGWAAVVYCQSERVCEILRNPMGYFPVGYLHDGVNLMRKYGVNKEIDEALEGRR